MMEQAELRMAQALINDIIRILREMPKNPDEWDIIRTAAEILNRVLKEGQKE